MEAESKKIHRKMYLYKRRIYSQINTHRIEIPSISNCDRYQPYAPWPILSVDRAIEYNPGVSVIAIKNVMINDNFFPGHFPKRPITPGVVMVEAMAQVDGLVMLQLEVEALVKISSLLDQRSEVPEASNCRRHNGNENDSHQAPKALRHSKDGR